MDPTKEKRQVDTRSLGLRPPGRNRAISGPFRPIPAGISPGSLPAELPGLLPAPKATASGSPLGLPLDVRGVAELIGCSPWTVRQSLIPRGLPVFRSTASGKLIFYTNQVVRWIENKQGGNKR